MWVISSNLRIKLRKGDFFFFGEGGGCLIYLVFHIREEERVERSSNFSLRSTELSCSVFIEPRTKVHLRDESYAWVLKTKDFVEDSSEEFGRSWVSSLREF